MARILLADDELATRELVGRALAGDGHQVTAVEDGQAALDRLLAAPAGFDLLITDVHMPALDGIALAVRARGVAANLRVLLMSGYQTGIGAAAALAPPVPRLVTKPFTLEQIRAEVRAALA